jgi:hypothetical protein
MGELNKIDAKQLEEIRRDFKAAMVAATEIFSPRYAFRKVYDKTDRRKPLNKALFEAWSVSLSKLTEAERGVLIGQRELILKEFMAALNNDPAFEKSISTGTGEKRNVIKRFETIQGIIKKALGYDSISAH